MEFWLAIAEVGATMSFPLFIVYGILLNDRYWSKSFRRNNR